MPGIKDKHFLFKSFFDKALFNYLDSNLKQISSPHFKKYLKAQNKFFKKGGKRLRPYLSYLFLKSLTKKNPNLNHLIPLELLHQFFLIHDDIIDKSKIRYQGPNLWGTYERLGERNKVTNPSYFGLSLSLIAGDLTLNKVIKLINSLPLKNKTIKNLLDLICQTVVKTIQGWYLQYLDTVSPLSTINEKSFKKSNLLVTSYSSFFFPIKYAFILSSKKIADKKILAFANPLGLAYQIHDDYLGTFASQKTLGKPVTSDLEEGKKTLFVIKAYQLSNKKERRLLSSRLGKKIAPKDFSQIKKIIKNSGSLGYCLSLEKKLLKQSLGKLSFLTTDQNLKKDITQLISFLINRKF